MPSPVGFDAPGNYQVYLTGQVADLMLRSEPLLIRVANPQTPLDDLPPWVWWGGGAGLAVLGGIGWWLRYRLRKPRLKPTPPASHISVVVKPNLGQWQGGFDNPPDAESGIRMALVVDLGEQYWDDEPIEPPDYRDIDEGQRATHTG